MDDRTIDAVVEQTITSAEQEFRYPDGKTPSEEARDSARMLGILLIWTALVASAVVWWVWG